MNNFEMTSFISVTASLIAARLTPGEIGLLAGILVQLGDTLATIAAKEALREERRSEQTN